MLHFDELPFPIAFPARQFAQATEPAARLAAAATFLEMTSTTLSVISLAWCKGRESSPGGVKQWHNKIDKGGIALSVWNGATRAAVKEMAGHPHDPIAHTVREAASAALPGLERYVSTRNRYAHGGAPRRRQDQIQAADDLQDATSLLRDGLEPMTRLKLGLIQSSAPGRDGYTVTMAPIMGVSPSRPLRMRSSEPLEEGAVVVHIDGTLEHCVTLSPYCIWTSCAICKGNELFYLHQVRKETSSYFSFSSGHEITADRGVLKDAAVPVTALGMTVPSGVRMAAVMGWRGQWADLAAPWRRLAARAVDGALAAALGFLLLALTLLIGLPPGVVFAVFLIPVLGYEPICAFFGDTPGKRLTRIEPVSIMHRRALNRADRLLRAFWFDVQIVLFPLAVRSFAWLLWDPARQCLHDRRTKSMVIAGRTRPVQRA